MLKYTDIIFDELIDLYIFHFLTIYNLDSHFILWNALIVRCSWSLVTQNLRSILINKCPLVITFCKSGLPYNRKELKCILVLSHVHFFVTPWIVACQAPLSIGFFSQEYWRGLPFPPPGDHPGPGIEPTSPVSPAFQADFFTTESLRKP